MSVVTDEPAKRGPGRPRDPVKRTALLNAARELFLERGSDAVGMEHVFARAGVSRATLYSNFRDKHELLAEVIAKESERIVTEERARDNFDQPVDINLILFGQRLLRFVAEADTMAFERLIAQAALSEPGYGPQFFAAGPGRTRDILESLIRAGQERGEIGACEPRQAVNDLLGLWQGFWRIEMQYGHRLAPDPDELDRLVRHGVRQFLKLYSVASG